METTKQVKAFCPLPFNQARISTDGTLTMCQHQRQESKETINNLFSRTFEDIWFSLEAEDVRSSTRCGHLNLICNTPDCPFKYKHHIRRNITANARGYPSQLEIEFDVLNTTLVEKIKHIIPNINYIHVTKTSDIFLTIDLLSKLNFFNVIGMSPDVVFDEDRLLASDAKTKFYFPLDTRTTSWCGKKGSNHLVHLQKRITDDNLSQLLTFIYATQKIGADCLELFPDHNGLHQTKYASVQKEAEAYAESIKQKIEFIKPLELIARSKARPYY